MWFGSVFVMSWDILAQFSFVATRIQSKDQYDDLLPDYQIYQGLFIRS